MDTPETRNAYNDMIIRSIFDSFFQNEEVLIVDDLYLTQNGKNIKLPTVVIYKTGVFLLETINFNARIIGDSKTENWKINGQYVKNPCINLRNVAEYFKESLGNKYEINPMFVFVYGNKPTVDSMFVNINELEGKIKHHITDKELSSDEINKILCTLHPTYN